MRRKLINAVSQVVKHTNLLRDFNEVLDNEHPGVRDEWETMIGDWEEDHSRPCPYAMSEDSMISSFQFIYGYADYHVVITLSSVRLILAARSTMTSDEDCEVVSVSEIILSAFEIEEAQYVDASYTN